MGDDGVKPYFDKSGITLYHADCLEWLPTLDAGSVDAVVTDPPYITDDSRVPIRGGGVAERIEDSEAVGLPWGYSLEWIDACERLKPSQWLVYANYKMLAELCSKLEPQTIFVWRKSNAPRMTRPVPRLDCEFVVWHRRGPCGDMGEFDSMVLDVPMPQAGCFAGERILESGSGKAAHPCQKPLAVVEPFIERLPVKSVLDCYAGTGTTAVACIRTGRRFFGCELEERYCEIAARRIESELAQGRLFTEPVEQKKQRSLINA